MSKRIIVSLALWLFCLPALGLSLGMAIGGAMDVLNHLHDPSGGWLEPYRTGAWGVLPLLAAAVFIPGAWLALLGLTLGWTLQRRLARWWPLAGTVAAILGLLAISISIGPAAILGVVYASPGIAFAVFLCGFHWHTDYAGPR